MKALSLFSIAMAAAAASSPCVAKDCENGADTMGQIRFCIDQENQRRVQGAYDHLDAMLKAANPEASVLLARAQKDWETFATSSCEVYARLHTDGPQMNDFRSECWTSFSQARVKVLQAWEKDLGKDR